MPVRRTAVAPHSAGRLLLLLAPLAAAMTACGDGGNLVPPEPCSDGFCGPPVEGQVFTASPAPPPISGGTLILSRDRRTAIAADPDRDRVWIVDLELGAVRHIPLQAGDEPGRVVEDDAGRVHVALRRGGAVVTLDPGALAVTARRDVCPAPRGLAHDAARDALHVACAGGELVTLPPAGGAETRRLRLRDDLRDVVVNGDDLLVSRFRAAEVLRVDATGSVTLTLRPPDASFEGELSPAVAWRMVPRPGGGAYLVHQVARKESVSIAPGGYASTPSCGGGVVVPAVTSIALAPGDASQPPGDAEPPPSLGMRVAATGVLPVDLAVRPDATLEFVAAGSNQRFTIAEPSWGVTVDACSSAHTEIAGEPIAVAATDGVVVVQSRERAGLSVFPDVGPPRVIAFEAELRKDTGHELFHRQDETTTRNALVCASCHPEGRDDGRVWIFDQLGKRRTQSVAGGVLSTLPLHWDGELADLGDIMSEVFVSRMSGNPQPPERIAAFAAWLDQIPHLPASPPADADAALRGEVLFYDPIVACGTCHSGPRLTNNQTVDVGTGGAFQVPALVGVAARAPYLHDGCAPTLRDRFGPCGGGDLHGRTSHLSEDQLADLVAFLETL